LDLSTPYTAQVQSFNLAGNSFGADGPFAIFPKNTTTLSASFKSAIMPLGSSLNLVVTGAIPRKRVTVGMPGTQAQCLANSLGQCGVDLVMSKAGTFPLLTTSGVNSVLQKVWVPLLGYNMTIGRGRSFSITVKNCPPKSNVVISTSDGQNLTVKSNSVGSSSAAFKARSVGFLKFFVSVQGVSLGWRKVLVS